MNIPSHYQSAFFDALDRCDDVDLQVVYFQGICRERAAEGWSREYAAKPFESMAKENSSPAEMVQAVPSWNDRIHIISGHFSSNLVDWFCEHGLPWCHWSEMPGIRLAEMLGYRMRLFRLLNPLMLLCKRNEGRRIGQYALGAFGQGTLARRAFTLMGIPRCMAQDLFYSPAALPESEPCREVVEFSNGRKVFLSVGALCKRKGIDVLLKAFSRLATDEWCLVLCGLDRANGVYQALAHRLGIAERVLFLGSYSAERIAEVYSAADVFVLASRFDGWGAVLNEAASLGLPIVGTDLCGASWHLIENGRNGYCVKAGSVASLAGALQAYAGTPVLVGEHGAASKSRFNEAFTPARNAERLRLALKEWTEI
jgi:glycosyltransferase involved in cell wall biosynthesis